MPEMAVDPNRDDELRECDCAPAVLLRSDDEPHLMRARDTTYGYCGNGATPSKIHYVNDDV